MKIDRIKQLAGLKEAANAKVPLGLVLTLTHPANMRKAVDAILEAGMSVDLSYSMGTYFLEFRTEEAATEAQKIVSKVIDSKKED